MDDQTETAESPSTEEPAESAAPSEEATPAEKPLAEASSDGLDEFLADDDEGLDLDVDASALEEKEEDVPKEPVAAADVETPPESEKPAGEEAPAETPAEGAEVEGAPAQAEPATPPETSPAEQKVSQEQLLEQFTKQRSEAEVLLAKEHYALSEDLAEELQDDAAVAIPKLMAKVYMDAVTASIGHVVSNLPQLVTETLNSIEGHKRNETQFFEAWPKLQEHKDTVVRLGATYRQIYPNAPMEDFVRDVGAQAMVALKIPVDVAPEAAVQKPTPPFKPASSAAPRSAPAPSANEFEALAFESDDLDLG